MRARLTAVAVAAILATGATAPASGATADKGDFRKCGKFDLGFTKAKVKAKQMRCTAAKEVMAVWRETVACPDNPCEVVNVSSFRCVQGGSDARVTLACNDRESRSALRAHWGG